MGQTPKTGTRAKTGVKKNSREKLYYHQLKTDYHVHPDYSIDAEPAKIKDYCKRAVEIDLEEICFTTHVELDPLRKEIDSFVNFRGQKHPVRNKKWLDGYFSEIEKAKSDFKKSGLQVKAGVEIGYDLGLEEEIETFLQGYKFDYVLCAVHCLDHIAISSMEESPRYFRYRSFHQLMENYFNVLYSAVKSGFFHCLAHFDLYRRYGFPYYGSAVLTEHKSMVEPILKELADRGMGLEINTSGKRRGLQDFHPSREIISLAAKSGVTIFTAGSDAHRLNELGSRIDEALFLLEEFNLQNHTFTKGIPYPAASNYLAKKENRR